MDVHDDFSLNVQVDVVNQAIDGGTDRPLDLVLDGHEAEVRLALRATDSRTAEMEGSALKVCPGQVGLGQERLLREGGLGAEIGSHGMSQGGFHSWAG